MLPMIKFASYLRKNEGLHRVFLHRALAGFLAIVMSATLLSALGLQYLGGYIPCKLCLEERVPYYAGLPLMVIVLLLGARLPALIVRLLFLALCLLMLYNAGLSTYHAGAEWKWWPGPTDCTSAAAIIINDAAGLLDSLNSARPAACDEASFVFLGLSLAGWNALASLFFALVAAIGACCKIKR